MGVGLDTAPRAIQMTLTAVGAPPSPAKGYPLGHCEHFLGTGLRASAVVRSHTMVFEPKDAPRLKVSEQASSAVEKQSLSSGLASKLRDAQGWLASNAIGQNCAYPWLSSEDATVSGTEGRNDKGAA